MDLQSRIRSEGDGNRNANVGAASSLQFLMREDERRQSELRRERKRQEEEEKQRKQDKYSVFRMISEEVSREDEVSREMLKQSSTSPLARESMEKTVQHYHGHPPPPPVRPTRRRQTTSDMGFLSVGVSRWR